MTVLIALLRGINVGGRNALAMTELRRIAAATGCDDVATYIQSGNLVFSSSRDPDRVAAELHEAILVEAGVESALAVRTKQQLSETVAANPFADDEIGATQLHVTFLTNGSDAPRLDDLDTQRFLPERVAVVGREVFLHLPDGIGRSKLAAEISRPRRRIDKRIFRHRNGQRKHVRNNAALEVLQRDRSSR